MSDMKSPNHDLNAVARVTLAMSLRAKKMSWSQIAVQCGYKGGESSARKAVQRELDRVVVRNVEQLRAEELYMLDKLHAECYELAMDKENKGRLFAVDRLLAISERRCKLMGLDAKLEETKSGPKVIVRQIPVDWIQLPSELIVEAGKS